MNKYEYIYTKILIFRESVHFIVLKGEIFKEINTYISLFNIAILFCIYSYPRSISLGGLGDEGILSFFLPLLVPMTVCCVLCVVLCFDIIFFCLLTRNGDFVKSYTTVNQINLLAYTFTFNISGRL